MKMINFCTVLAGTLAWLIPDKLTASALSGALFGWIIIIFFQFEKSRENTIFNHLKLNKRKCHGDEAMALPARNAKGFGM